MADDKHNQNGSLQPQRVTSTSRSLLVRLKDNDGEAWDRLVVLYAPLVYHWCQKMDLSRDDMPDVVQEVFKSVSENIANFRKERPQDTFRGWLRVITRNKVMDHFRRDGKQINAAGGSEAMQRIAEVAEDVEDIEEDDQERRLRNAMFHKALKFIEGDFQERTWKAFWRIVVDDCTPTEVAKELGMSPGAVRVAKCRVLQRLREDLGEAFAD